MKGTYSWVESVTFSPIVLVLWHYPAHSRSMSPQNLSVAFMIPIRTAQRSRMFPLCTHSDCLVWSIRNALYTMFILVMTFWQTLEYECEDVFKSGHVAGSKMRNPLVCLCVFSAIACWRTSHLATWHNATLPNKPISCHSHLCLICIGVKLFLHECTMFWSRD